MDSKMKKPHMQTLKFLAIIGLLIITSFFSQTKSTNNNSKYNPIIHLILNILIIVVGADAGLLSFVLHSPNHYRNINNTIQNPNSLTNSEHRDHDGDHHDNVVGHPHQSIDHNTHSVGNKEFSDPPPSDDLGPTVFFIEEGCNNDQGTRVEEEDDDDDEDMSEQELYHKAETFIGNFYRQLKMQREESWNKLHQGFSQH